MIFKVLYQETLDEIPVRESTHSMYVEGDSEKDVRKKLAEKGWNINIEFVQGLSDEFLEYEKQSEDFKVEQL
ncbi:DNA-dependent RNA polymerase subunit epsilon [Tuberibacillus sp. Marseille-P3662]|uniref:DNA-dependent RNA polymerase subunit epsilon n=1 Tax=Tuberibacillus sp. Marseille-P3662 TaxID=1965358 RepID=UPI000A1C8972|nr:DNA-directed RNA polymerase subunit epsilon [Tuberibacillus sp. Marseille-P3662]